MTQNRNVDNRRAYGRMTRAKERAELKQFRALKLTLKNTPAIDRKIAALKQAPAFNDVGLILEPLIAS